jgi:hypothetical protein
LALKILFVSSFQSGYASFQKGCKSFIHNIQDCFRQNPSKDMANRELLAFLTPSKLFGVWRKITEAIAVFCFESFKVI